MQERAQHGEMSQLRKEIYGSTSSRLAMTPQLLISETTEVDNIIVNDVFLLY